MVGWSSFKLQRSCRFVCDVSTAAVEMSVTGGLGFSMSSVLMSRLHSVVRGRQPKMLR